MEYNLLGRTNLKASVIGIGGEWLNGLTEHETLLILDEAIKNGINIIDIFMPQASTRDNIGMALKGKLDKMIIQGHLCTIYEDGQYKRTRDVESTKRSFEDLLTRLQTSYIDIGMIHYVDSLKDYKAVFETEIIEYAKELKRKGIIGCIGMSSHNPRTALKAVKSGMIDTLMFSINPAYDMERSDTSYEDLKKFKGLNENSWIVDPKRQELYTVCEKLGVGITVMKSLGSGNLLKKESSPFNVAMSVPQCINYSLSRQGVKSVFIGFNKVQEIYDALEYFKVSDAKKDYSYIFIGNNNIKITGRCMYCNHCLPCPSNINIAKVTKFLDLALIQERVPETIKEHYFSLEKNSDDCIMCGKCEPNCPFGVKIRQNMKKARAVFIR